MKALVRLLLLVLLLSIMPSSIIACTSPCLNSLGGGAIAFIIKLVYADGSPAAGLEVVLSRTNFSNTPVSAYVVGVATTNSSGIAVVNVSSSSIGFSNTIYAYVRIPVYNIYLVHGRPIAVSGDIVRESIVVGSKPIASHIVVRVVDEYGAPVNTLVQLYYGGSLLFNGSCRGTMIINETSLGQPILDSSWLDEVGASPHYSLWIEAGEASIRRSVTAPSEETIVVDLHPPEIISANATIFLPQTSYGSLYANITVAVKARDGANTKELTGSAKLVSCSLEESIRLYKVFRSNSSITLVFTETMLVGLESITGCENVYVEINVVDPGGHIVGTKVYPRVINTSITNIATSGSMGATSHTSGYGASSAPRANTTSTYSQGGSTAGLTGSYSPTAGFQPPPSPPSARSSLEVGLKLVIVVVMGVSTIILEFYRRRIQGIFR